MKEITILTLDMKDLNKPATRFMLQSIEEMYKNGIRITVFAKSFSNLFPPYITRKKISISGNPLKFKYLSKSIAGQNPSVSTIIATDYPTHIIAAMVKDRLIKYKNNNPLVIWYSLDYAYSLYSYEKNYIKMFFKNILFRLENKYGSFIDIYLASSKKIARYISYIHPKIENIEIVYPGFQKNVKAEYINSKEDYFLIFYKQKNDYIFKVVAGFAAYIYETSHSDKMKLKIVGFDNAIKSQVEFFQIEEYVEFLPYKNAEEYADIFERAYGIIIYDRFDNFNNIEVFDALSTKTFIIIDRFNSASEITVNMENAIVTDVSNPLALKEAILLSLNKEIHKNITDKAYEYLDKNFNPHIFTSGIIKAIK